jgi:hypothetical protein
MEQDVSPVTALVVTAAAGDQQAWRELVDRYAPLLVSVIRGFRLTPSTWTASRNREPSLAGWSRQRGGSRSATCPPSDTGG